jgi:hypothetical protein
MTSPPRSRSKLGHDRPQRAYLALLERASRIIMIATIGNADRIGTDGITGHNTGRYREK